MTFLAEIKRLSERQWQKQLTDLAKLLRWAWWHDNATNAPRACPKCKEPLHLPRNTAGFPDLLMLRDDTLIVVELKDDRGRVTPDQQAWLDRFKKVRRILVVVWRPRDFDAVQKALR